MMASEELESSCFPDSLTRDLECQVCMVIKELRLLPCQHLCCRECLGECLISEPISGLTGRFVTQLLVSVAIFQLGQMITVSSMFLLIWSDVRWVNTEQSTWYSLSTSSKNTTRSSMRWFQRRSAVWMVGLMPVQRTHRRLWRRISEYIKACVQHVRDTCLGKLRIIPSVH